MTTSQLLSIKNGINASQFTNMNNMFDGKYMYSLNRYKDMFNKEGKILGIHQSSIDKYLLKLLKTEYLPEVEKQCAIIASIPIIEQKTPEWFKQRETMISASDAGYFLKKCGASKAIDSLKIKVGLKSYCNSSAPPLMHGNTYEDVARAIYESRNSVSVTEYGILSSPTSCIGASPDGVITKCHKDTYECQSKYGRLLEIKNPYSREIDNTIKPEYMVQILQQQYTTGLPICDFVETTIVDAKCNTSNSNYKPYMTLVEMLADVLDKSNPSWESRIKNKNIPDVNLNKFGNEKGLVVWYKKQISETDTRNKYILYPLAALYEAETIEKWVVDTNSEQWSQGYSYVSTKYWRLDVYSEKTVIYDKKTFEDEYVPQLCKVWDVITNCNNLRLAGGSTGVSNGVSNRVSTNEIITKYIEDEEANKDSPFYNENKRKKKAKIDDGEGDCSGIGGGDCSDVSNSASSDANRKIFAKSFKPNKDIELDF